MEGLISRFRGDTMHDLWNKHQEWIKLAPSGHKKLPEIDEVFASFALT
jgi:hypothetical protein|tara:strand:+ start:4033 stop:4176 length:144 start_codon:yes stop_codon:yes gene_type:complete